MTNQTEPQSLVEFADRVTNVVTNLNGLIGRILNEEITISDLGNDLTRLSDKLKKVEAAVNDLLEKAEPPTLRGDPCSTDESQAPDVETLMEWDEEGGCEATDGCWVEPDGVCPHGCQSWLLVLGLI